MRAFFRTMIPLFSDMTALYCMYLLFSFTSGDQMMWFSFPLYLFCGMASAAVNLLLSRRERTLASAVLWNLAVLIPSEILLLGSLQNVRGITPYLFGALFFLYPTLRAFYLVRHPVKAEAMLVYCEMSILGTGLFLLTQAGSFSPGPGANLLCLLALALNLCTLSSMRAAGRGRALAPSEARMQRMLILAAAILLLLTATAVLGLLLPAGKDLLLQLLAAVKSALLWFLRQLEHLLSLLAAPQDMELPAPEPPPPISLPEQPESVMEIPAAAIIALLSLLAAGLAALLCWLFLRFRKLRLRWRLAGTDLLEEKIEAPPLFRLLLDKLRTLRRRLVFFRDLLLRLDTCAGMFVRLPPLSRRHAPPVPHFALRPHAGGGHAGKKSLPPPRRADRPPLLRRGRGRGCKARPRRDQGNAARHKAPATLSPCSPAGMGGRRARGESAVIFPGTISRYLRKDGDCGADCFFPFHRHSPFLIFCCMVE